MSLPATTSAQDVARIVAQSEDRAAAREARDRRRVDVVKEHALEVVQLRQRMELGHRLRTRADEAERQAVRVRLATAGRARADGGRERPDQAERVAGRGVENQNGRQNRRTVVIRMRRCGNILMTTFLPTSIAASTEQADVRPSIRSPSAPARSDAIRRNLHAPSMPSIASRISLSRPMRRTIRVTSSLLNSFVSCATAGSCTAFCSVSDSRLGRRVQRIHPRAAIR